MILRFGTASWRKLKLPEYSATGRQSSTKEPSIFGGTVPQKNVRVTSRIQTWGTKTRFQIHCIWNSTQTLIKEKKINKPSKSAWKINGCFEILKFVSFFLSGFTFPQMPHPGVETPELIISYSADQLIIVCGYLTPGGVDSKSFTKIKSSLVPTVKGVRHTVLQTIF